MPFAVDDFVQRCRAAVGETDARERIAQIVREAVGDPEAIADTIRDRQSRQSTPTMADVFINSDELTIYHVTFPPNLFGVPHDHAGWAVIGVYKGAEAFNVYEEAAGRLVQRSREVMQAPAVAILPEDLIHDIDNPSAEPSGSIHVYSNRHFDMPGRRIWRDGSGLAEPFTFERSFAYGVERTQRIRRERGIDESDLPKLDELKKA